MTIRRHRHMRLWRSLLLSAVAGMTWAVPAQGGTFTAYSREYQRAAEAPVPVVSSFSVLDPSAPTR